MREVICLHIGQAGVQISGATWELFCVEHGIEANGKLKLNLIDDDSQAFKTFFNENKNGQFIPRAVFMDLEPTVIDEVRKGVYRNLFHPDYLINTVEDGCSNYARGHFTVGKTIINQSMDTVRHVIELCENLQGFFVIHSQSGGTGAGFTSLVMEDILINFPKQPRYQMSIFPSNALTTSVVEPYNCVISVKDNLANSDVSNIFNNEAIFKICTDLLDTPHPTYSNLNRVLSQLFSDITVSLRFESTLNSDLSQIGTNLIPYPKIHFITSSHSPLSSQYRAEHEKLNVHSLTRDLFKLTNQFITCDIDRGVYMSCILQYRGEVSPKEVSLSLEKMKAKKLFKFVEWCPTGFKLGINSQPPVCLPSSGMFQSNKCCTMLVNGSSVKKPLERIREKFDMLFSKRSFIHWFVGEGMEEGEFNEAGDDLFSVLRDYDEVTMAEEEDNVDVDVNANDKEIPRNEEVKLKLTVSDPITEGSKLGKRNKSEDKISDMGFSFNDRFRDELDGS